MDIFEVPAAMAQGATVITFPAKAARRCRKHERRGLSRRTRRAGCARLSNRLHCAARNLARRHGGLRLYASYSTTQTASPSVAPRSACGHPATHLAIFLSCVPKRRKVRICKYAV